MPDPGSYMSLAATLVMAVVVVVLLGAWLAIVFRASRQAAGEPARQGEGGAGHAAGPGADARSQSGPGAYDAGKPAERTGEDGSGELLPHGAVLPREDAGETRL